MRCHQDQELLQVAGDSQALGPISEDSPFDARPVAVGKTPMRDSCRKARGPLSEHGNCRAVVRLRHFSLTMPPPSTADRS